MPSEAAEIIARALEADAMAQGRGETQAIGMRYDDVLQEVLPINDLPEELFGLAFSFWDGWLDAANHNWLHHDPITKDDWPKYARTIASNLRTLQLPTEPVLVQRFIPIPKAKSHSWASKLKTFLSGRT